MLSKFDFKMATTSTTKKSSKRYSFKGTREMKENLIESIKSFKASMTFKNLDFNAGKAAQYSAVLETMAATYCDDETLFGPTEAPNWPENFGQLSHENQATVKKDIKIQKDFIVKGKIGYGRKQKKSASRFPKLLCWVHAEEVVNWFLNITRSWSPYGVVLLILSLCHLEFLVESWMTNIKSFPQI